MRLRGLPIAFLAALPWVIRLATGRAFSFAAIFVAKLDLTLGLAIVGSILSASALVRIVSLTRTAGASDRCRCSDRPSHPAGWNRGVEREIASSSSVISAAMPGECALMVQTLSSHNPFPAILQSSARGNISI